MTIRPVLGMALAAALVMGTAGSTRAQSAGAPEQALLNRAAQNPPQITVLLDLARMYLEQGRLEEAERMLRLATVAVQQARAMEARETRPTVRFETGGVPVRVGSAIKEPRKIRDVRPVYPEIAQAARVQGIVIIEVIVDELGLVRDAKVLRSVPLLDEPALDAVRQWQFVPTLLNGVPVPIVMTVTVNFTLS